MLVNFSIPMNEIQVQMEYLAQLQPHNCYCQCDKLPPVIMFLSQ